MKSGGVMTVALDVVMLEAPLAVATSTLPVGRYVRLGVGDSGSGIEPRVLERIFDPFFTTKEVGVGTGLGLSLVHGIVTDLGGGIAVDTHIGKGTTFTIYLPWQPCEVPVPPAYESIEPGAGQTVLLVDDEEALVRLGEETLAGLGYEPVGFTSPIDALAAFRSQPQRFDAVLTDESMPGMNGSELCVEIRRLRPTMPIVLMSGYVNATVAARAREAGAADVLAKPVVSRELARSLAVVLERATQESSRSA
jgi:CheY-like chemotaxis protein